MANPYRDLEKALGYRFRRRERLETALIHRSYRFENEDVNEDNQRLEFLGDAVLGLVTAAYAFDHLAEHAEGVLTSFRSQTTSGKALADIGRALDLGSYLRMGKGEEQSGGRRRASNLADALEAILGAAFLDGGNRAVDRIFRALFVPRLAALETNLWAGNPKGKLQEISQRAWRKSPVYRMTGAEGPPHATIFSMEVVLDDGTIGCGTGRNKQEAQAQAAADALAKMNPDLLTVPQE